MADAESFQFNKGLEEILDQTLNPTADTLKWILVGGSYTPDRSTEVADAGGANDIVDAEINVTGYTPGWGGAGRKPLAGTVSMVHDDANDAVAFDATTTNYDWGALGVGATITGAVLVKEGATNDTTTRPVLFYRIPAFTTDGATLFSFDINVWGLSLFLTAGRVVRVDA